MLRARVIGHAISTVKHPSMEGVRLMVMMPLGPGEKPDGDPLVVADTIGASVGSVAVISSDGKAARKIVGHDNTPVRYFTVGLED